MTSFTADCLLFKLMDSCSRIVCLNKFVCLFIDCVWGF